MAVTYLGGDITELSCSHPTLGDFRFAPKANESFTIDPGGIRNDDDSSNITGGGKMIQKKNRVLWSIEGPIAIDYINDTEHNAIPKLMESAEMGVWTLTHISGVIWKGTGIPVGDFNTDTNTAQGTLKISGDGKLEKIS